MINNLLLLSGNDIPFIPLAANIHQPTIKEIAYIGEKDFFSGCELLKFSKDILDSKAKNDLMNYTNFDIIMSMVEEKSIDGQKNKIKLISVLTLLFPEFDIKIHNHKMFFQKEDQVFEFDSNCYEALKEIIISIFCLKGNKFQTYDPEGDLAKAIADKLKKGKEKTAKKKDIENINILERYVSILSVGEQKDMNQLLNYTVYQLFDEYERYELKMQYDLYVKQKMLGAKDLKEVDFWMKDIHE